MATCTICDQDMCFARGCSEHTYRSPRGGELLARQHIQGDPCQDCNAQTGEYHHPGCDRERCPFCGGQLISCDCHLTIIVVREITM